MHPAAGLLAAFLETGGRHEVRRGLVGGCIQELVQVGALIGAALLAVVAGLLRQSVAEIFDDLRQHGGRILVPALV